MHQPASQAEKVALIDDALLSDLRELDQGETGLLRSFIDGFHQAVPEHVALMREALAAGDAEQLRKVAHRLKGTAANVAAQGIAAQCQALEELAGAGQLADVAGTIRDLEQCYERTNALFAQMRVCQ
jgi:HPt (histidine-containing phosphotransfer) domain-containing protein